MFNPAEHGEILNADPWRACLRTLERHGLALTLTAAVPANGPDREPDLLGRVDAGPHGGRDYEVTMRTQLTAQAATALRRATGRPLMVLTPHVGTKVADILRELDISWVDGSGNLRVEWEGLHIDVQGHVKRSPTERVRTKASRAFGRAGLQVQFVLLSWPELHSQSLRALADASQVSLGSAQLVVDELTTAGYMYESANGRELAHAGELLSRWAEAYSTTLGPKLHLGSYRAEDTDWWKDARKELDDSGVQIGGEAAGSLLNHQLRPTTVTLYANAIPSPVIGRYRLRPAVGDANVEVRRRFWKAVPQSLLVPTTLVYADLLASGDPRQREHADLLRGSDDQLKRLDGS